MEFISPHRHNNNTSINKLNLTLKASRERTKKIPKISGRKEIINVTAEINEIETKKTITKINETKSWFFEKTNLINLYLGSKGKTKGEESNQ